MTCTPTDPVSRTALPGSHLHDTSFLSLLVGWRGLVSDRDFVSVSTPQPRSRRARKIHRTDSSPRGRRDVLPPRDATPCAPRRADPAGRFHRMRRGAMPRPRRPRNPPTRCEALRRSLAVSPSSLACQPPPATIGLSRAGVAQSAERLLPKQKVEGSRPFSRSISRYARTATFASSCAPEATVALPRHPGAAARLPTSVDPLGIEGDVVPHDVPRPGTVHLADLHLADRRRAQVDGGRQLGNGRAVEPHLDPAR